MTCRHCVEDAFALLVEWGFTPEQASGLVSTVSTVFLVPVGAP